MNRRRAVAVLSLVMLVLSIHAAAAQSAGARAAQQPATAPAPGANVATVGGRPITAAELDQRAKLMLDEFTRRKGSALPADMRDVVRRQVLEGLVRAQLMTLEAKRLGVLASVAEGDSAVRQLPYFNPAGRFDAARYEGIKAAQPAQFAATLASAREQVAARKFNLATELRFSPPVAEAQAGATRALTRVSLDFLALHTSDFEGTFDEPREAEVEAWYRGHLRDYEREARATLTIVFVNSPALADSLRQVPAAVAQWDQRMHAEAGRLIAGTRKGVPLDSVAASLGLRGKITVTTGNFPGYWRGTAAQSAAIFEPGNAGRVQPEPVRGTDGWLVVRVDECTPAHLAAFRDVAREVRTLLRKDHRLHRDENDRRALYAEIRDSLAAPGWPIRYAAVDTALLSVSEPGEKDLDTYFRSHQADYSRFDSKTGAIVSASLAEVREDVRSRYLRDRRDLEARALSEQLLHAWQAGRRDPGLEARFGARLTPPVVAGSRIDTGFVAGTLSDTLWTLPDLQRGGVLPYRHGFIVWQAQARVELVTSTFEQAQRMLSARLDQRRAARELAGARAIFDADPARFRRGNVIHFTRINFRPVSPLDVTLTRDEVEKWHHDHIDRYSAPEMVSVRHILITPANKSASADRQALDKATEILRRIKAGESFSTLARAYSEDPATRETGGELGSVARGSMLEDFENVVFTLPAGTLYDRPLKTELGYHVVEVTEHLPPVAKPLPLIYSAVSNDAATEKGIRIAVERGDSLLRVARNPRTFAQVATRAGASVLDLEVGADERVSNPDTRAFFDAVQSTSPGHIVPGSFQVSGQGAWLAVVDSITPSVTPTWDQARNDAIVLYRRGAGARALDAKRAEMDSLLAGGMSFDSLGAYWGGLQHVADQPAGRALRGADASDELDSLLFGGLKLAPGLAVGHESSWTRSAGGMVRLRLLSRIAPGASEVAERAEQMRRAIVERRLKPFFEDLKLRYPVVILDRRLRDVSLAPDPGASPEP